MEGKMLNIRIDNPELEKSLKQCYGDDSQSIAKAFLKFVQQENIKRDVGISIEQLDAEEGVPLSEVMREARKKYES